MYIECASVDRVGDTTGMQLVAPNSVCTFFTSAPQNLHGGELKPSNF